MKVIPVGTNVLDFVTKEGTRIVGTNLYVTYPEEGVEGLKVEKFFINPSVDLPSNFVIGSAIDVYFNQRGKVEAIHAVPQSTTTQPTTPARPATAATAATTTATPARPATAATAATTATARPRIDKEVE